MALRYLIVFVLVGCSVPRAGVLRKTAPLSVEARNSLYIVVSDFSSGGVRKVDLSAGVLQAETLPAHADALARWDSVSAQLLVLNRLAGNHLTLATSRLDHVNAQIELPEGSNPQDVLPLPGGDVYFSFYHHKSLLRWNLNTGRTVGKGIDLSEWADGDGYPEASYLASAGDRVLLALQRLDIRTYTASEKAYLLVLDPSTDTVDRDRTRLLARSNPFTEFKQWQGDYYLGEAGVMQRSTPVLDGGIERIDGADFHSKGLVIDEAELGGDILDFEILDDQRGVAIISTPDTELVRFNPSTGKRDEVLFAEEGNKGFRFSQVLVDRERSLFYLADRDRERPAVRVFGFDFVERVESRIALELPPFKMVLAR